MSDIDNSFFAINFSDNDTHSSFKEVPTGSYEAELSSIKLGASKTGKPMITAKFHILESYDAANQGFIGANHWCNIIVLNTANPSDRKNKNFIARAKQFLTDLGNKGKLDSLYDIQDAVADLDDMCKSKSTVYEILISENKGFKNTAVIALLNS